MSDLVAVIEVPTGSRNKYEMDHDTGAVWLDRRLFTSMQYPAEYGFIEDTLAEDGDPLDVLVAVQDPTFPGCHIAVRPVALIQMSDEKGPDAKILAVPTWDTSLGWHDVGDVPEPLLAEIKHFFERYKDLEKGKFSKVDAWLDHAAAVKEIEESQARFAAHRS